MSDFRVAFPYDAGDPVPSTVYYVPDSVTLTAGDDNSDVVADVQTMLDGNVYQVSEVADTPGYDFSFTWNEVTVAPTHFIVRFFYDGSDTHECSIRLWNYGDGDFADVFHTYVDTVGYTTVEVPIPEAIVGDYIEDHEMKMQFYHDSGGNASHEMYVDYVAFVRYAGRPSL